MTATLWRRTRSFPKGFVLLVLLTFGAVAQSHATALADMSYWISMRGITEDAHPSFVTLSYVETSSYSVAFAGCHGHIYYLQSGDAATVQASRAAGETVQIHRGEPGTAAPDGEVICMIQADQ